MTDEGRKEVDDSFRVRAPEISAPKGGGAIRGIGEKFSANPVTGTGRLSVPLALSPGRSGFGPTLALSYDSGAGNGPFGLGWSLGLPAISRKTDRGLPQYNDAAGSDVFLLSGAEDLVPVLANVGGRWVPEAPASRFIGPDEYQVRRYRPRIEGLFARIERWTHGNDVFWRSISRDNVTTFYGRTPESRVADPADPARIFSWLMCETRDDKGNVVLYDYQSEDSENVDLAQAHERNRASSGGANRYLKRIRYGNTPSRLDPAYANGATWHFEVVFDYGEGHYSEQPATAAGRVYAAADVAPTASTPWPVRPDPFSTYRSTFEVRTYRLCRRVLMFHRFAELGADPYLVRSTELGYDENPIATRLVSVSHAAFVRDGARGLLKRSLPPIELGYNPAPTAATLAAQALEDVDAASLDNVPVGLDGSQYQWADLDGEGLSGILALQESAWYYKPNLGGGRFGPAAPANFGPTALVRLTPSAPPGAQLLDLAGDGQLDVVVLDPPLAGFYERNEESWDGFRAFASVPNVAWRDPNLRFVDLTGDGHADIAITEDNAILWYPSLSEDGFGPAERVEQLLDEEKGPRLVFADATQSVFLADMSGDGLTDLVRIRNGEVCYWPNTGYGRFGSKVTMDRSPWFDAPDQFDQKRIRLADVAGSGLIDLVYLHRNGARLYLNESGNRWGAGIPLPQFPRIDDHTTVQVLDLLGAGTACLVWSSPHGADAGRQMRYVDLMGGKKPYLLTTLKNNLGAETQVEYAPSTKFYLADKFAGTPWITRLPFPVHCVERVTITDTWRKSVYSTTYSYRHGFYDGVEREFRGFAQVSQLDAQTFDTSAQHHAASPYVTADTTLYQPPIKTVTWFHTGMATDRERALASFEREYFPRWFEDSRPGIARVAGGFVEHALPDLDLGDDHAWSGDEWREALRACKGMVLRQEVAELDVDALAAGRERRVKLFSSAYHNCRVRMLQGRGGNPHAVFLVTESEAIAYQYELDVRPDEVRPDPRISHTLNLQTDEFGNVLQSVAVAYPRGQQYQDPSGTIDVTPIRAVQSERHVAYSERRFTNAIDSADDHRLPSACEARTYELSRFTPSSGTYFSIEDFAKYRLSTFHQVAGLAIVDWKYHETPTGTAAGKRQVEHVRTLLLKDDLSGPLGFAVQGALGLAYESYKLALTSELLTDIFGAKLADLVPTGGTARAMLDDATRSGYLSDPALANVFPDLTTTGQYWMRSGSAVFAAGALQHFVRPDRYSDAFGHTTKVTYDGNYHLWIESVADPLGNTTTVNSVDLRVLAPTAITDANDNHTEVYFDAFGLTVATALRGKGSEGDDLTGFDAQLANPDRTSRQALFIADYDEVEPRRLLARATSRYAYSFGEALVGGVLTWGVHPAAACGIVRETHVAKLTPGDLTRIQAVFEYTDGLGAAIVKKAGAEPDPEVAGQARRWIASGKTILNNKGKPVKQYEPYFCDDHRFEEPREVGVTPILYYDAPGRLVRTEMPDGTLSRVEFSPWHVAHWDANDTVKESQWYVDRGSPNPAAALPAGASADTRAAWLSAKHASTPALTFLDGLGRNVVSVADLGVPDRNGVSKYQTFTKLDAEGKPLWILDARGNIVLRHTLPAHPGDDPTVDFVTCQDVAGNLLFQHGLDAGDRWMLTDAAGKPMLAWDQNERKIGAAPAALEERIFLTQYDALHRTVSRWLAVKGGSTEMVERFEYVNTLSNPAIAVDRQNNLVGQPRRHYDPGGLTELVRLDFKGDAEEVHRQLTNQYDKASIDWQTPGGKLETEVFAQVSEYDALGRPTLVYAWHRQGAAPRVAINRPHYNERGLVASGSLEVRAIKTAGGHTPAATPPVMAIAEVRYDAKGQKQLLRLANGTLTRYAYDRKTLRLTQLLTRRTGAPTNPAFPLYHAGLNDPNTFQQLSYTYDAIGNITQAVDEAFATVYFQNQAIDARSEYEYDALNRLVWASGRENGALTGAPRHVEGQSPRVQFPITSNDPNAQRRYDQTYQYDAVGNLTQIQHAAGIGSWTQTLTPGTASNRLQSTQDGSTALPVLYRYDTHGNMLNLAGTAPGQDLRWDYRDMIASLDLVGGGHAYYAYDAEKNRTRKRIVRTSGEVEDRVYLGGYELYRRYSAANTSTPVEEIDSLHLFEGKRRVLLVDDVITAGPTLFRYQYGNHLGSVCAELDDQAQIISYEEHHPYGTSAYRLRNVSVEAPPRRYRYTGMERDEESGLSYHRTRFYSPSLSRWTACDPAGTIDGTNLYRYARNNPVGLTDPAGMAPPKDDSQSFLTAMIPGMAGSLLGGQSMLPMLNEMARLSDTMGREWGVAQFTETGGLSLIEGYRGGMPSPPPGSVFLAHGHGLDDFSGPSVSPGNDMDLTLPREGGELAETNVVHSKTMRTLVQSAEGGESQGHLAFLKSGGVRRGNWTYAPGDPMTNWQGSSASYAPGSFRAGFWRLKASLSSELGQFAAAMGNSSRMGMAVKGLRLAGEGFLGFMALLGSFAGGWQLGTGLDKFIFQRQFAEGALDIGEGSSNLGLSVGTALAVKAKLLVAEAGFGAGATALLAGVAAGLSVGLFFDTARKTMRGEETMLDVADKAYGTGFTDIYAWQKRSVVARVLLGVATMGLSEAWYDLNKFVE